MLPLSVEMALQGLRVCTEADCTAAIDDIKREIDEFIQRRTEETRAWIEPRKANIQLLHQLRDTLVLLAKAPPAALPKPEIWKDEPTAALWVGDGKLPSGMESGLPREPSITSPIQSSSTPVVESKATTTSLTPDLSRIHKYLAEGGERPTNLTAEERQAILDEKAPAYDAETWKALVESQKQRRTRGPGKKSLQKRLDAQKAQATEQRQQQPGPPRSDLLKIVSYLESAGPTTVGTLSRQLSLTIEAVEQVIRDNDTSFRKTGIGVYGLR